MAEHPTNSIYIEPEIQYDYSTLDSSKTGSLNIYVVTPQKIR